MAAEATEVAMEAEAMEAEATAAEAMAAAPPRSRW
tara:strand:- start:32 stop:136 length:105 start_codon:yes stop_codon:yes gene_type:complete